MTGEIMEVVSGGLVELIDGQVTLTGGANVAGVVRGTGSFDVTGTTEVDGEEITSVFKMNGGYIAPGLSPGILTINGDYSQDANSVLEIEIGGYEAGTEHDVLDITGNASIDGTIVLNFIDGFAPKQGDTLFFLEVAGVLDFMVEDVVVEGLKDGWNFDFFSGDEGLFLNSLSDAEFKPVTTVPLPTALPLLISALISLRMIGRTGKEKQRTPFSD